MNRQYDEHKNDNSSRELSTIRCCGKKLRADLLPFKCIFGGGCIAGIIIYCGIFFFSFWGLSYECIEGKIVEVPSFAWGGGYKCKICDNETFAGYDNGTFSGYNNETFCEITTTSNIRPRLGFIISIIVYFIFDTISTILFLLLLINDRDFESILGKYYWIILIITGIVTVICPFPFVCCLGIFFFITCLWAIFDHFHETCYYEKKKNIEIINP